MTSRNTTKLRTLPDAAWSDALPRRLSERLFTIAWGAIQWPWLARSLSGGKRADKARLLDRLGLPADALPNLGSWKADTALLTLIADLIEQDRPACMVELGCGASSLIAGRALALHGGGRLVSYDQHEDFVAATGDWLAEHGVRADLRHAPLGPSPAGWPGIWYQPEGVPDRIDLLVIDGPPWTIHPFVRGAAEALFDRIAPGGTVLLDDAARPGERVIAKRWRERWPDFEFTLLRTGTKGTLIGRRNG